MGPQEAGVALWELFGPPIYSALAGCNFMKQQRLTADCAIVKSFDYTQIIHVWTYTVYLSVYLFMYMLHIILFLWVTRFLEFF